MLKYFSTMNKPRALDDSLPDKRDINSLLDSVDKAVYDHGGAISTSWAKP